MVLGEQNRWWAWLLLTHVAGVGWTHPRDYVVVCPWLPGADHLKVSVLSATQLPSVTL